MGVEYASITAALALLGSSLSGAFASVLPTTSIKGSSLAAAVATAHHVPSAPARAAYAKAPYGKPELRYLYAIGWIASASDVGKCTAAKLLGPDPTVAATQALQGSSKVLALLRRAHITVAAAAGAIGRGVTDGCP